MLFTQGISESVQKSLSEIYKDSRFANPFIEHWGKGRPTLEKQIRRDLCNLWACDHNPTLRALTNPSESPMKTVDGKITIRFIQRG